MPKTEKKIRIYFLPDKLKIPTYALNRWTLCIFIAHLWQAVHSLGVLSTHASPVLHYTHIAWAITHVIKLYSTVEYRQIINVSVS